MELARQLFCSLIATILLSSLLFSQKLDVRGIVIDSASGEKIPFATVTLIGTQRGAVTNNNGFFLIAGVSLGTHEIVITSIGYESQKKNIAVAGTKPITINFSLKQSSVEVSEVVISSGRRKELSEINTSVHVLDIKELSRVPVAAQDDLLRSLQILPGIVTSADVSSKFYVRGGAGDQNLILLDGMKIYNPYHAFGIFSIFDPDIIKSTEIYTGAFPPGFGGRLSSVINLTSRDGNKKNYSGQASLNFISGKLQLEGPLFNEHSSWIVSGRKSLFSESFKKFVKNTPPISFYDIFAKVNIEGAHYGKQSFYLFSSGDDIISDKPTDADHYWRSLSYGFSLSTLIEDHIYLDAIAYASDYSIRREVENDQLITPAESNIKDGGIRGELTFYTESRDLYFLGFDVNVPRYAYKFYTPSRLLREVDDAAVETWAWFRYQGTTGKTRYDIGFHSDIISLFSNGNLLQSFQPRINVSYLFESEWCLKASYGLFSQNLITLSNEDDIISLFESWIFIPKTLEPEIAHHGVLGIDGNIYSELSLNVQTYYKAYTSLITYNREKRFPDDADYMNGTGKSYGIETMIRYGFDYVDFYLAYTLGWTSLTSNNFTYTPRYDRRHSLNLLTVFKITDNIDFNIRWEYGSGYPFSQTISYYERNSIPDIGRTDFFSDAGKPYAVLGDKNGARLPAYHRMDVGASYNYTYSIFKGSIGINIVNVYDNKNIIYYDRKTGQKITMLPFFPTAYFKVEF